VKPSVCSRAFVSLFFGDAQNLVNSDVVEMSCVTRFQPAITTSQPLFSTIVVSVNAVGLRSRHIWRAVSAMAVTSRNLLRSFSRQSYCIVAISSLICSISMKLSFGRVTQVIDVKKNIFDVFL